MQPRQPSRPNSGRPQPAQPAQPAPSIQPTRPAKAPDTRSLFRRAQERVSATREDGSSKFVNADQKQKWLDEVTPLYLHKLIYRERGRFGPEWTLHLSEDAPENPIYFASFKDNDYRAIFFPELQAAIESSGQAIGPLMLTTHVVEGQQNPSWDLQEWREDGGIPF